MQIQSKQCQNQYLIHEFQVGGRTLMLRSADGKRVYKKILKRKQFQFYKYVQSKHISDLQYNLKTYIPLVYQLIQDKLKIKQPTDQLYNLNQKAGQWFQRIRKNGRNMRDQSYSLYMEMQNFCFRYNKLNLMDIKVGKMPRKTKNILAIKNNFKVSGAIKTNKGDQTEFAKRSEAGGITCPLKLKYILAWFFVDEKGFLLKQVLLYMIQQLKNLLLVLKSYIGWQFDSASICFVYDSAGKQNPQIKMIDFGRSIYYPLSSDVDSCLNNGISNLIHEFKSISYQNEQFFTASKNAFLQHFYSLDDEKQT